MAKSQAMKTEEGCREQNVVSLVSGRRASSVSLSQVKVVPSLAEIAHAAKARAVARVISSRQTRHQPKRCNILPTVHAADLRALAACQCSYLRAAIDWSQAS